MTTATLTSTSGKSSQTPSPGGGSRGDARIVGFMDYGQGVTMVYGAQGERTRWIERNSESTLNLALKDLQARMAVGVAAAAQLVCRVVSLPETRESGDREGLAAALALAGEAELPPTAPAHRRASGVIAVDDGARAALLTAWSAPEAPQVVRARTDCDRCACGEVAALASLCEAAGGARIAVSFDSVSRGVAIVAVGEHGIVCRVTRVGDGPNHVEFIQKLAGETAQAAGLAAPHELQLPTAGRERWVAASPTLEGRVIAGSERDGAWINRFGLAYGAWRLAASDDAAVRSLATLRPTAPVRTQTIPQAFASWIGKPGRPLAAVVAACIGLLFIPLGVAAARHALLSTRAGGIESLQTRLDQTSQRASFYRLLRQERWPMTKLLADISGAAPVGVEVESLDITADNGIRLRGTAETSDQVTEFRENINKTGVFANVATPSIGFDGDLVEFQLDAKVGAPLFSRPPIQDFAAQSLFARLYGDDAQPGPSTGARDAESGGSGAARRPGRRGEATQEEPATIPEPITDEAIAAMDQATAMKEFSARNKASNMAGIAKDVATRLKDEAAKCKARMLEAARANAGSTPAAGGGQ